MWHRMTRMTGPDFAVMGSLINTEASDKQEIILKAKLSRLMIAGICTMFSRQESIQR